AVATTVASSICMNRAQPTMNGIIRMARRSRAESACPPWALDGGAGVSVGIGQFKLRSSEVHSNFKVNHFWQASIMAKNYESEITQFLKKYKTEHPDTELRQREGRARLWDKHIDPEFQEGYRAGKVPQKPYVYQAD